MAQSRIERSVKNMLLALSEQFTYSVMSFICRTVFIYTLGKYYLGFSGLFSDILSLLSLAELGFGTAITYLMYKPAAINDYKTLAGLLNTYKKIYILIGSGILVIGLAMTPFLKFFISNIPNIPELPVIYWLYLLNTVASYFFSYKRSILIVYQKNYIISLICAISIFVQNLLQIIFLITTKNYILYLVIQVFCTFANNVVISLYVDRQYKAIIQLRKEKITKVQENTIAKNVKAMMISKLSSVVVSSTDNLLISSFVSTVILGLYSNYAMFITMIRTLMQKVFDALTGSVGNMIATENVQKTYDIFTKLWFIDFWLSSFCSITLYTLVDSFISLWLDGTYLLKKSIVFLICINLFMRLMRNVFLMFIDTYGLFVEIKKKCLAEALINLIVSLILVGPCKMGILGILLGTFISNITTNFWVEPYIIFVGKFNVSMQYYFYTFSKYFVCTISIGIIEDILANKLITANGWIGFIIKLVVVVITTNIAYIIIFHKSNEFKYMKQVIKNKVSL